MVEFFSAEIVFNVCRYRSCIADGVSAIMSAASFRERDAVISPSAAITWKRVYLSNRSHFLWVYRRDNPRGMLGEPRKACKSRTEGIPLSNSIQHLKWVITPVAIESVVYSLRADEIILWLPVTPSAKQRRNPCSGLPAVYPDLSTRHDWPVKKGLCFVCHDRQSG